MIKGPVFSQTKQKIPQYVNVIKQKKIRQHQTSWNSPEHVDKLYSSRINEKVYMYSFLNLETAKKCFEFLKKYKEVNGYYPDLHGKHIKRVKEPIENYIYIDDENLINLKKSCLLNGVGLIGISNFEYTFIDSLFGQKNIFNLNISAIDLLEHNTLDNSEHIEHLNYLLDF
jgi:hypothetical protein